MACIASDALPAYNINHIAPSFQQPELHGRRDCVATPNVDKL
jgi:hypothetical protein